MNGDISSSFSALELKNVSVLLSELFDDIMESIKNYSDLVFNMKDFFSSEDCDLDDIYKKFSTSIQGPQKMIISVFEEAMNSINKYVNLTVENEESSVQQINQLNSILNDFNDFGKSLVTISAPPIVTNIPRLDSSPINTSVSKLDNEVITTLPTFEDIEASKKIEPFYIGNMEISSLK